MDWKLWCQLCGKVKMSASVKVEDVFAKVKQVLQLESSVDTICVECYDFVTGFIAFKLKSISLQEMFAELQKLPAQNDDDDDLKPAIETIRVRFGLTSLPATESIRLPVPMDENCFDELGAEFEDPPIYDEVPKKEIPCNVKNNRQKSKVVVQTEVEKLYDFKCHICELVFLKMQLLTSHCRTVHQTAPLVSCWCGQVLSSWKRLMAHKSKHTLRDEDDDDDELSCQECRILYKTKSAYDKHMCTKHGPDGRVVKFMCSVCGKEFKERQIMKNHEKIHLPDELKLKHPCSYCGKKFVNSHCLKIHIARVHEKIALHTCELCGKGCITKSDLKWHMDKHVEERKFECDVCHLMFKSTNSLRIHKRRHFNQNQHKVIVCSVCGKEFFSSAALSNHKLVHCDVKRYKCFCGMEYKRLESYKCHLNSSHTGERPFKCPWCKKTFFNSANCRKHKLKDHPSEVTEYEAIHGKKGVSLALNARKSS